MNTTETNIEMLEKAQGLKDRANSQTAFHSLLIAFWLFLALKLTGHIDWSWWLVCAPVIIRKVVQLIALLNVWVLEKAINEEEMDEYESN